MSPAPQFGHISRPPGPATPHLQPIGADEEGMSATVALRHQERVVSATRPWRGSRLAESARLATPEVRHRARAIDDEGPGTEVVTETRVVHPMVTVARLWLGVLSIFALIVFLGLVAIILGAWAFGFRPVVVTSGSMSPVVRTGDIVITKPVHMEDKVGNQTVIDFEDPATDQRHLHRIIEVTGSGYRTKGDANADPDPQVVPKDHVHGAGFILAPYVGYLPMWVDQRAWRELAVAAAILVALATMSKRRWMWAGEAR